MKGVHSMAGRAGLRAMSLPVALGCLILVMACGGGSRATQTSSVSQEVTVVPASSPVVTNTLAQDVIVEQPGATEPFADTIGSPLENDTWRITITAVERAATFRVNKPKGQWVIVRGIAENRTTKTQILGKDSFLLTTPALNGTIDIDRTATWELGDIEELERTVARFGGYPIDAGTSVTLLMVFDVPLTATELELQLPTLNRTVPLGKSESLAELVMPVASEAPTAVSAQATSSEASTSEAPTAVSAQATSSETSAVEVPLILDMPGLVGQDVTIVEEQFGPGQYAAPFDAGDRIHYSGAGEARNYVTNGYGFLVNYDTNGRVVGLWIEDGLEQDNYDLSDWPTLFKRVGLPTNQGPDVEALAAVQWENLNGYAVEVIKTPRSPIWQIQVWEVQD